MGRIGRFRYVVFGLLLGGFVVGNPSVSNGRTIFEWWEAVTGPKCRAGAADLIRKIFRDRESPALPLAGHVEPPQALGVDAGHLMSDLRRQQGQRLTP